MSAKFVIRESINGSYYFVLKSKNGGVLMESDCWFRDKNCCIKSIKRVQKLLAEEAPVIDTTK